VAGARQIVWRGHAQAPVVGQTHADQAGVAQVADPHRAVHTLVDDVDHAVRQVQREADVGVLGEEVRHQRRHMSSPEACRGRDA